MFGGGCEVRERVKDLKIPENSRTRAAPVATALLTTKLSAAPVLHSSGKGEVNVHAVYDLCARSISTPTERAFPVGRRSHPEVPECGR